jgi:hypothetical protein
MARVGYSGERDGVSFSVAGEVLTARANAGIHNDDGSEGANLGALATGAGVEATVGYSGWSVTAGASISVLDGARAKPERAERVSQSIETAAGRRG